MSRGTQLQEMEVGTKQSRTAVNAGAKSGDSMQKLAPGAVAGQTGGWEDLGGPTPENYRSTDDSAKINTPGKTLAQVKNVVNKGAKAAEAMPHMKSGSVKEQEEIDNDLIVDEEELEDEEVIEEAAEEDEEESGEAPHKEGKKEKGEKKEGKGHEKKEDKDEEEMKEEFDIEEDVNALLEGEELSEEFQEKARVIFEAALRTKVDQIKESLEEQYEEKLVEAVSEIQSELEERVDAYLEYVSEEWMTENQLAVESGLKEELTDSFLSGLKGLFEEHYVTIPEDKYDVLHSMVDKLDEMEEKLNEQIEKNVHLNKRLAESVAEGIFDEISEGLAHSQKDKLASLAESVEFESEAQYREKLETLKESYFPSKAVSSMAKSETLSEGVDIAPEYHSDSMNAYLRALSVTSPKS
jgi:hypothetical protein